MVNLSIVTSDGYFVEAKPCEYVNVQSVDGNLGILGHMAPFVTALKIGVLTFQAIKAPKPVYVHVHQGILMVDATTCKVLSEHVYLVDENGERIKTPQKLA